MHITHETAICLTHTIPQTEIPALLDSWVKKHTFYQNGVSTKKLILIMLS